MPLKNGLEVCKEVRAYFAENKNLICPKIVFVSSHGDSKAFREHCQSCGVDKVFQKPIETNQLEWLKRQFRK
jgi:CheY-like chemotaxis protein